MLTFITIAAMVAALIIGLAANQYRRRRAPEDAEEVAPVSDLISPLETLAVLLVAFVIVLAAESFGAAGQAVGAEAHRVDQLYEVADYAPEPHQEHIQADAVCYARAILAYEWPQMDKNGEKAPEASVWSSDFRRHFKDLARAGDGTLDLLIEADDERSVARQTRLSEAAPAIPPVVYWFMVVSLAATIGAFAFGLPARRGPSHFVLLFVLAGLFTGSLLLIEDIDRPFSGHIHISSTSMEDTVGDIGEDFADDHPGSTLPCDVHGARTGL
ncbi:hypothetical protein GCM10010275_43300 [Streptomyces litmocidini]|uniref:bestrophin-like domain n=1 Tax=Streptomyces litmocidini TaxID=67318 RepID=UPI00167D2C0B|nr:DUF4239 domain-containing protein [Streptomyces litmocidini]GGU99705.1 hypothetical protein GCM10010275_43300 [Streptomyces litmocidini]